MVVIKKVIGTQMLKLQETFKNSLPDFPEYSPRVRKYLSSQAFIKKLLRSDVILSASEDDKFLGFIAASNPSGGVMSINWLAILETYRKKGYGTQLLNRLESYALKKGVHNIQVYTSQRNINFYKKRGFVLVGIDEKSYLGVDLYILKKLIQMPDENKFLK
jgi:ribosomal protein S18 acetylase RimI-like enzyme